jgi:undecaprenyl-diphosphatase
MTFVLRLIGHLAQRDRGLYARWSLRDDSAVALRRGWLVVTHAGGATVTIAAVLIPLVLAPWPRTDSWRAALSLVISHLVVQAIKRFVCRPRPDGPVGISIPDRFSFPSGHATSSLAIALAYAAAFPSIRVPLVTFGLVVGWSRVALGVHYPGDVLAGQLIATLTVLAVTTLT